ncbi:MAG: prepilin-type N-terminal cleavage/methylation domain-containing protein [Planctomycetes bacterium]|nr:prepilin-type N-terminal cleavage/methylation domain-containing protein [Planctomycetota bacterium]MCB9888180.1 prepilin-type N-terminal cleavage/methylation domain-containing protein [Planctomycetota bacterium]
MKDHPQAVRPPSSSAGFTLLEMLITIAILAVVAAIGIPYYRSSLTTSRITRAREELRVIAEAIDVFRTKDSTVVLPATLADVGYGGKLDPWGHPYLYLNFEAGTGNGMQYALDHGLVDPALASGGGGGGGGALSAVTGGAATVALNAADKLQLQSLGIAVPLDADSQWLSSAQSVLTNRAAATASVKRKDKFLFPINSDYDLFSLGPNGTTRPELTDKASLDDVIRANNGAFYGQAKDY